MKHPLNKPMKESWREFSSGFVLVFFIASVMLVLEGRGLLVPWQTRGVDAFLSALRSKRSSDIRLVSIHDDDYNDPAIFGGQSPLRRDCVQKLIDIVAAAQPRLIVVDLDISDPSPAQKHVPNVKLSTEGAKKTSDECALPKPSSGIGADASFPAKVHDEFGSFMDGLRNRKIIVPGTSSTQPPKPKANLDPLPPILWAQTITESTDQLSQPTIVRLEGVDDDAHAALPIFPSDEDGQVRSYWLARPVLEQRMLDGQIVSLGCRWRYTFAGAAAKALGTTLQPPPMDAVECGEKISVEEYQHYLRLSADPDFFISMDARAVLQAAEDKTAMESLRSDESLKNKIVIIGGAYAAARDTYITQAGKTPGMNLVAYSIRTVRLSKGGAQEGNIWLGFICDLVVGAILVLLGILFGELWEKHPRKSLLKQIAIRGVKLGLLLLSSVVLPIVASLVLFESANFFLNFVPVSLGAILHTLHEWSMDGLKHKHEHEIEDLKKKLQVATHHPQTEEFRHVSRLTRTETVEVKETSTFDGDLPT